MNWLFLCLSLVGASWASTRALTPRQDAALDKYIHSGNSDSVGSALHKKLVERIADLEARISVASSDLQRLGPPTLRRLGVVQESLKTMQNVDLNVYNDQAWREYLLKSQTSFCCSLHGMDAMQRYVASLEDALRQSKSKVGRKDKVKGQRRLKGGEGGAAGDLATEQEREDRRARHLERKQKKNADAATSNGGDGSGGKADNDANASSGGGGSGTGDGGGENGAGGDGKGHRHRNGGGN